MHFFYHPFYENLAFSIIFVWFRSQNQLATLRSTGRIGRLTGRLAPLCVYIMPPIRIRNIEARLPQRYARFMLSMFLRLLLLLCVPAVPASFP